MASIAEVKSSYNQDCSEFEPQRLLFDICYQIVSNLCTVRYTPPDYRNLACQHMQLGCWASSTLPCIYDGIARSFLAQHSTSAQPSQFSPKAVLMIKELR